MPLRLVRTAELEPAAPFHFDATVYKPDHFPSADNESRPGVRWQTMRWEDELFGLKLENVGTVDEPQIRLSVWAGAEPAGELLDRLIAEVVYRYSLDLELAAFYRRARRDPRLEPVIERWRGMRPLNYSSLYEYLVIAIVLQNATARRSVQMLQALFERYGTLLSFDGKRLYAYWPPQCLARAPEDELRGLKVGYRARSLRRVSAAFASGAVDELALRQAPLEEQRRALLGLYGVGPASAGYILSDVFHQLDELSHISPWEQKIYSKLFFDTDPEHPVPVERLLQLFEERFAGFRGLAVHYLWEDLFWQRREGGAAWLEPLIRL